MINLKNKKIYIFFIVVGIIQIFYYGLKRNDFRIEILKNPFQNNSHINYSLPKKIIESNNILKSENIKKFNLSKRLKEDMFTFQRIIEFNYPLRFEERSKFTLFDLGEKNDCEIIKSGKLLELKKCQ